MMKVKNVRPGILLISDAGIRLEPGEIVEVETPSKQMEQAFAAGLLAQVRHRGDAQLELPCVDLADLTAKQAISQVETEEDTETLRAHLAKEQRRTVIDVLEKRLEAIEGGSG